MDNSTDGLGDVGFWDLYFRLSLDGLDSDLESFIPSGPTSPISDKGHCYPHQPLDLLSSSGHDLAPLEDEEVQIEDWIEGKYLRTEQQQSEGNVLDGIVAGPQGSSSTQEVGVVSLSMIENQPLPSEKVHQQGQTEHRRRRKSAGPHFCEVCNEEFPRPRELRRHVKKHTRPLRCQECPASAAERRDLIRHYWAWHPAFARVHLSLPPPEPSTCAFCKTRFTRSDNLKRHLRKAHGVVARRPRS